MAGIGRAQRDERLALALAQGMSVVQAAARVGISERSARRRVADPAFRRRVADLRAQLTDQALGVLTALSSSAAITLGQLLRASSEAVQLGAARSVLEIG